jgi:hypothetical protein
MYFGFFSGMFLIGLVLIILNGHNPYTNGNTQILRYVFRMVGYILAFPSIGAAIGIWMGI